MPENKLLKKVSLKKEQRKSSRYRDIATELQKEIRLGSTPVGELLPTETELMARFGASRQTVREALRIITEQGLIVRRAGLGSVVIATEPPVWFTHRAKSSPTAGSQHC
jgi:GntR family transcriptional regulator